MKRRHLCSRDQDEPLRADYYSAYAAYGAEGMSALRQKSTFDDELGTFKDTTKT
jgi:hypothetical protein